ncbi:hypothetical protein [Streptomyces odonnellii]|uniref:hypothetical protein n=1 Tax=Streptomyces odonnellii TaxID=1417980 RepID=UPI000626C702|nr:hypothetical protein [Streptomyces odonnellii]
MRTRATRFTGELLAILVLGTAITVVGTWASSDEPADPAACKAGLAKNLDEAMKQGDDAEFPAACENVDDTAYQRLVDEVYNEKRREIEDKYQEKLKELAPPTPPTP